MPFWKIAWRNMQQRALASSLTALSMALGVAVMIAVILIHSVTVRQFEEDARGYHVIVGGRGGALQLVLSTVYHVGMPLYPIPYTYYQKFLPGGEFSDVVQAAIPVCLGDSYVAPNGSMFRVVGTTPAMFDEIHYGAYSDGTPKSYEFQPGGRNFKTENFYEAVVGSVVAAQAGLKVGDKINPTHGLGGEGHKHEGFEIVGILKPTGTSNDRGVFINIEGFYLLEGHAGKPDEEQAVGDSPVTSEEHEWDAGHTEAEHDHADEYAHDDHHPEDAQAEGEGHEKHGHEEHEHDAAVEAEHHHADEAGHAGEHAHEDEHYHDHEHTHTPLPIEQRKVTSILVLCNNPFGPTALDDAINRMNDPVAQVVSPAREIQSLLTRIIGPLRIILLVMTVLIVIVAGVSILVSIYNSMSERSHDIAVMRALGASRSAVMTIILVESILIALLGGALGVLLGHGIIGLASPYVVERTGVSLSLFEFDWQELVLIPGLVVLASVVGLLPALAAYRTDVARSLSGSR
jgi:putative ABC transport system permease protein